MLDEIPIECNNNIIKFLRPIEYAYLNKYYNAKSKEISNRASCIIFRNVYAYFTQIKTINHPIRTQTRFDGIIIYNLINSTPFYISIYLKKFYPRKLINGALIFYVSNINRYNYEVEDNDLIKMLVFISFYMSAENYIKISEVLRILPKKYYLSLYKCFNKYKLLNNSS